MMKSDPRTEGDEILYPIHIATKMANYEMLCLEISDATNRG